MNREYGAGDRDQGFELAAAFDDAPVAFAQEGVGTGGASNPGLIAQLDYALRRIDSEIIYFGRTNHQPDNAFNRHPLPPP